MSEEPLRHSGEDAPVGAFERSAVVPRLGGEVLRDERGPLGERIANLPGHVDETLRLLGLARAVAKGEDCGEPGEAWAYRSLPVDVPQLPSPDGTRDFGAPLSDSSPGAQLVFLRTTDATGRWTVAQTPVDEHGDPYRGMDPDRLSPRVTPSGGGVLVGDDSTRGVTVLDRDATGRYHVLPAPDDTVLLPAGGGAPLDVKMASLRNLTDANGRRYDIRNLRSFQTTFCDDYWNWGYYVAFSWPLD